MSEDSQARPRLVGNERVRLTGTFLNNLAGSCAFAGVIAPVASLLYTVQLPVSRFWAFFVLCWGLGAIGFHVLARSILRRVGAMTFLELDALAAPFILLAFGLVIYGYA